MVRAQPQSGLAHCPQVLGHVVGIPAARQEAGPSFRGTNAAQSLGLLGFARVVCEGAGYFTVFEGVRVCLCMYVPVRCMCPCVSFPEVVWGTPVPVGISAAAACQLLPPRRSQGHLCLQTPCTGLRCGTQLVCTNTCIRGCA